MFMHVLAHMPVDGICHWVQGGISCRVILGPFLKTAATDFLPPVLCRSRRKTSPGGNLGGVYDVRDGGYVDAAYVRTIRFIVELHIKQLENRPHPIW